MKKTPFINRNELALKYGISTRTLNKRLKHHNLDFGADRALSPKQVKQVIDALGGLTEEAYGST